MNKNEDQNKQKHKQKKIKMKPKRETKQNSRKPWLQLTIIFYSQISSTFHYFLFSRLKTGRCPIWRRFWRIWLNACPLNVVPRAGMHEFLVDSNCHFFHDVFQCLNLTNFFLLLQETEEKVGSRLWKNFGWIWKRFWYLYMV